MDREDLLTKQALRFRALMEMVKARKVTKAEALREFDQMNAMPPYPGLFVRSGFKGFIDEHIPAKKRVGGKA